MEESRTLNKCIIVDDEQNAIDVIILHLADYLNIEVEVCFTNAIEASSFLKNNKTDLMFLDIQMPGISGIDFLRSLRNPPAVFLTTAYRHYAPEAFELNVLDYLLKPISSIRFKKAIEKFENHIKTIDLNGDIIENYITVRADRSNIRLKISEILFLESKGDYVKIHLESKHLLTKETLKNFIDKLPSDFRQIHRSFIVNSKHIDSESSSFVKIGNVSLPLSRSFKTDK